MPVNADKLRLDPIRNPGGTSESETDASVGRRTMHKEVNVLALVKGGERFVFLYDSNSVDTLLEQLGQHAADPDLTFTWYDAAVLSQRVRKLREESEIVPDDVTGYSR